MAAQRKENYSQELTEKVIKMYTDGESVETIAESIGKATRSVISKLVRENVYVAPEKTAKARREEGPTKKELIRELEMLAPFPVDGFMNATKEAIQSLIALLKPKSE